MFGTQGVCAGAVEAADQRGHGAPGMTQTDIDIGVPMKHPPKISATAIDPRRETGEQVEIKLF